MELKNKIIDLVIKALPQTILYRVTKRFKEENSLLKLSIAQVDKDYSRAIGAINEAYSQEGEDLIIKRFFGKKDNGFYIDVGAYDPVRFSNTYYFYRKGWRGINIDARPGSKKVFDEYRGRDINIEAGISANDETILKYYSFSEPAYNTMNPDIAKQVIDENKAHLVDLASIKTYRLSSVLDKYLPKGTILDFLSVDVEGMDYEVLQSNNWEKYSPKLILIESYGKSITQDFNSPIYVFLKTKGYELSAKTVNTLFFVKNEI